jgi:hypothetical protein
MSSFGVIKKIKTIDNFMVNKEHLSNNMKKIFTTTLIISFILFNSCEDVNVALPGNTQDLDPKPPTGDIVWAVAVDDEGRGLLDENSAAGITIGTLNATDPNPDDEFTYAISSQTMDGTSISYFILNSDSGYTNLELSNGSINFEALTGSKQVDVIIRVSDDSPEPQSNDFSLTIKIVNVNETPIFSNLSQIKRFADEYVDYESPRIEWTDTDEGDNPELTTSNLPGWLSIDSEGNIGSSSPPESGDVGNHEFLLKITDEGGITVQEEINIEVRENLAPEFTNLGSIPSAIRVGCYDDNDRIVDLNWNDPNNSTPYFNGNDIVAFTHQGLGSVEWLNFDNDDEGKLFCVRAPENSDTGTIPITISLADNRPSNPLSTEFSFDLELIENDAPEFTNLGNFPNTISVGDTIYFDVEWQDPNSDAIDFSVTENYSWFIWDNSGNIEMRPTSSHVGEYDIPFNISDGCYTSTTIKTLTVE